MWRLLGPAGLCVVVSLSACGDEETGAGFRAGNDAGSGGASTGGGAGASQGGAGNRPGNGGAGFGGFVVLDGGPGGGSGTGGLGGGAGGNPGTTTQKLDVLLVVDNSISMADKQAVLRDTVPDLVRQLTDPALRIADLHVGVVTSSLGGYGSTLCTAEAGKEQENDLAHLLGTRPRAAAANLPAGFAAWTSASDPAALVASVQALVDAAGEFGCGFEATLEAMYRFLVEPSPPASHELRPCTAGSTQQCLFPVGRDDELLAQRGAFLRPDSALAVVVLSDENDCSIRASGQYYWAARQDLTLGRGSAACSADPNNPCCYSCVSPVPSGCTPDPTCQSDPNVPAAEDSLNLRCFEQRRRFGLDFLYPVARYVNALTRTSLCTSRADLDALSTCPDGDADGAPDIVQNPLFGATAPGGGASRDPRMVYALGIVGVPWQTIRSTADTAGNPIPASDLVYPSGSDLARAGVWEKVVGDPGARPPVAPTDPLMVESFAPRTGITPGTGEPLAPPTSGYLANSVNGHERTMARIEDLQYACIFPLREPRDCEAIDLLPEPRPQCACSPRYPDAQNDPLCQLPSGVYGGSQVSGKAYPSTRILAWLRGLGDNAAVGSICTRNLTDEQATDYGYRPAIDALARELGRSVQ